MSKQPFIDFTQELAQASGAVIRKYFRSAIDVETKMPVDRIVPH